MNVSALHLQRFKGEKQEIILHRTKRNHCMILVGEVTVLMHCMAKHDKNTVECMFLNFEGTSIIQCFQYQ